MKNFISHGVFRTPCMASVRQFFLLRLITDGNENIWMNESFVEGQRENYFEYTISIYISNPHKIKDLEYGRHAWRPEI